MDGLAIPHGEFEPAAAFRAMRLTGASRSLMGSSNRECARCHARRSLAIPHGEFELFQRTRHKLELDASRDPSWGVRTLGDHSARYSSVSTLAIPHGEFEPVQFSCSDRSSADARDPSWGVRTGPLPSDAAGLWPRDPSWGVRTRPSAVTARHRRDSRSLMGSSNHCRARAACPRRGRARDPSWGVRTAGLGRAIRPCALAIPHGEFEPRSSRRPCRVDASRDPSWGVRTAADQRVRTLASVSRSLMGSSNGVRHSGYAPDSDISRSLMGSSNSVNRSPISDWSSRSLMGSSNSRSIAVRLLRMMLAIPHGEFEPAAHRANATDP